MAAWWKFTIMGAPYASHLSYINVNGFTAGNEPIWVQDKKDQLEQNVQDLKKTIVFSFYRTLCSG